MPRLFIVAVRYPQLAWRGNLGGMAIASEEMPSCLNRLKATLVSASKQGEQPRGLIFSIACPACGGSRFRFREVLHGESSTGICVRCLQCATEEEVFDGLVHGYDGKLGHTDYLNGPREIQDFEAADGHSPSVETLFATFTYNLDPSELEEISRENGIPVIELYDWFELSVKKSNTPAEYETIWDYECA
jgi:hypothetical protein